MKGKGADWWLHSRSLKRWCCCALQILGIWMPSRVVWPSACLESSLQWGHYGWSKSRLEAVKVHSIHALNQAWVSTLQPSAPCDGGLLSPPVPQGASKRERIHSTGKGWTQVWAVVSSKPKLWPVNTNSLPSSVKKITDYYQKEQLTTKPLIQEVCIQISHRTG